MNNKAEAFNQYCAEVMRYELSIHTPLLSKTIEGDPEPYFIIVNTSDIYNPYDDANQRHEVFDKLWRERDGGELSPFLIALHSDGIDQAEREFIWSTNK